MTTLRRGLALAGVALLAAASAWAGDPAVAPAPIRTAHLLDAAKGNEATKAFRKIISRYCAGQDPEEDLRPGPEYTLGLGRSGEAMELDRVEWKRACPPIERSVQAIASGSFTAPGKDEVVLVVVNGRDRAEGDYSLALMEREGREDRYRLRRVLAKGQGFTASIRIAIAGRPDVLLLCERGGGQGEYHGTCGFFGRGTFHEPGLPTSPRVIDPFLHDNRKYAARNELAVRRIVQCGPSWAVELGKVAARGDRLVVSLIVETSVNKPSGDESVPCENAVGKRQRTFEIEYQLEGRGFRRATPIPRQVTETLNRD